MMSEQERSRAPLQHTRGLSFARGGHQGLLTAGADIPHWAPHDSRVRLTETTNGNRWTRPLGLAPPLFAGFAKIGGIVGLGSVLLLSGSIPVQAAPGPFAAPSELGSAAGPGAPGASSPLIGTSRIASGLGGPSNDVCAGAQTIEPCGTFPKLSAVVSLTSATPDGDPVATCGKHAGGGVWFSFTPATTGTFTFSTCTSETTIADTVLALYNSKDNVCPSRGQVACNNDDAACEGQPGQSTLKASLTAGTRYFLVAYAGAPGATGNVQVSVAREEDPLNGGFETGDFTGWAVLGVDADVAIVSKEPPPPCFAPDMPSEGCFMACLSTETFFGGAANGLVRSDLTSDAINFDFRPQKIRVTFGVDFQTEEPVPSAAFNDAFQARLVTNAGTFVILQIDTFGRTPDGKGLKVVGDTGFTPVGGSCPLISGRRTKRLEVTWTKTLDPAVRAAVGSGPVFIEFSVADQGNTERTSLACVDGIKVEALHAK